VYTPLLRIALIAICLVAAASAFSRGFWMAWLYVFAAVVLAAGYWRSGTVWVAWRAWRGGDVARAERLLAGVRRPDRLPRRQRVYYDWLQGELHRGRGDAASALVHFEAASRGRLRGPGHQAFVAARIAESALACGDRERALRAIEQARSSGPTRIVEDLLRWYEARLHP
jgi:hypothetical protein